MKILTWNVNGYRSALKNNYIKEVITYNNPDIICFQEMKMNEEVIDTYGYIPFYNFALKKGYSGVAIYTKEKPIDVIYKTGFDKLDDEGRFILLEYKKFIIINIYIPHGGRKKENHPYKFLVIDKLMEIIKSKKKNIIICTDFNIAHEEIDVKNYKTNYNNNMFSYEERKKIDELLSLGFVDSFRSVCKSDLVYSMWPNGFNARKRNMGWRIDYIFISKKIEKKINDVKYLSEQFGSDHCPCILDIDL